MRYFTIIEPSSRQVVAMADEDALGRVLSACLHQWLIDSGKTLLVQEATQKQFERSVRFQFNTAPLKKGVAFLKQTA